MGDLARDTEVVALGDGRYRGTVSREWEIWGPMGGYIASLALRAAGAETSFARPASFFCHYLAVARFDEVDIEVRTLRGGRNAQSLHVTMSQDDRAVLDATVWAVADVEGLEHDVAEAPDVPGPEGLLTMAERMAEVEEDGPPFPFWNNFDVRPISWNDEWPPPGPIEPRFQQWERFIPASTFTDPWVDGCRTLILTDVVSWPAASRQHAWKWGEGQEWISPSLDLYVAFHQPCPDEEWLLCDGYAPVGADGLIGWNARLWSQSRTLVATGAGQTLCRRVGPPR